MAELASQSRPQEEDVAPGLLRFAGVIHVVGTCGIFVYFLSWLEYFNFLPGELQVRLVLVGSYVLLSMVLLGILCFMAASFREQLLSLEVQAKRSSLATASANTDTSLSCPECGELYPSNWSGNFCESCGGRITA